MFETEHIDLYIEAPQNNEFKGLVYLVNTHLPKILRSLPNIRLLESARFGDSCNKPILTNRRY